MRKTCLLDHCELHSHHYFSAFASPCFVYNMIVSLQAVHKIQSSSGPLDMRLVQVPKMLSVLRKDWAPKAFCISFKVRLCN